MGDHDHTTPYPGDHGIMFEPGEPAAPRPWRRRRAQQKSGRTQPANGSECVSRVDPSGVARVGSDADTCGIGHASSRQRCSAAEKETSVRRMAGPSRPFHITYS
jgi:hypothetical protein